MNDNEILVGAVGGTPTVVDTNNQGDILASASGLDIKANTIVNADVNASAGIVESKLALDYATATLNTDIGNVSSDLTTHTSNTSNPHSVTKSQVLTGDPIVNADVDASAGIEESKLALDYSTSGLNTAITTHTGDVANPHSTKIANLGDVVLTTPINDKDVINWDSVSQKFVNSAPLGGALSTLSDVTLTSPTDKQLVQYDYANSKWVNSSEVWNTIEVNEIANINNATANITLTASDKRHQIFTATNGFNITLPSTGIKAGETFVIEWSKDWFSTATNSFKFYSSDNTLITQCWFDKWVYTFTALQNTPTSSTHWKWSTRLSQTVRYGAYNEYNYTPNGSAVGFTSGTLYTIPKGFYVASVHLSGYLPNLAYTCYGGLELTSGTSLTTANGEKLYMQYYTSMPMTYTSMVAGSVVNKTLTVRVTSGIRNSIRHNFGLRSSSSANTVKISIASDMILVGCYGGA